MIPGRPTTSTVKLIQKTSKMHIPANKASSLESEADSRMQLGDVHESYPGVSPRSRESSVGLDQG